MEVHLQHSQLQQVAVLIYAQGQLQIQELLTGCTSQSL